MNTTSLTIRKVVVKHCGYSYPAYRLSGLHAGERTGDIFPAKPTPKAKS